MIIIIPFLILVCIVAWLLQPGKTPSRPRVIAILVAAVPVLLLAIVAVIFQLVHNAAGTVDVADIANTCFVAGAGFIAACILASVGFALARKGDIARGMGFGLCIALVVSIIELGLLEWLGGV
jgi:hypothetical protein